ncbi:sulfatase [Hydrogenophaga taeniospiralis CCUG 15921]|uniref:Sulfatase n=2 Tax=Hydrogenophaga TaxID=47420 RepID=A0A9X4NWV1_9BURK|nr:sulfatase [Hydrogenophaga taeniospiralis CCUG 15921]
MLVLSVLSMQVTRPLLFVSFSPSARGADTFTPPAGRWPAAMVWPLALWLAVPGNLPLWQRIAGMEGSLAHRVWLLASFALLMTGAIAALLSLLAWPRLFRPAASGLLLVAAFNTHFMWQYGAVIDPTMFANVVQTDAREVRDLLSLSLLATVLLVAAPPLWWLWQRPLRARGSWQQAARNTAGVLAGLGLALLMALLSYQDLASLMRNQKALRYMANPLNTVYAATRLAADQWPRQAHALQPVGEDARLGASYAQQPRPPLLVLVVGETARADHFMLDGYARPTTPALARWQAQGELVNFSQVHSCGTNTQVSVPCLFSPLTRQQGGDQTPEHENLLDVLQRAGLAVLWLDNQSGCKGVCDRVPHASTLALQVPGLCEDGECFDAVMLQGLDQRIAALDPQRRARGVVVVMHQMGSHGPAYFKRTPASHKPFQPECRSNTLSDCPAEQLINAYDNTLAYTDHFLDQTLQWLQTQAQSGSHDTGLIYLSDHGESLGENGLYLHGVPYSFAPEQQTHVPMVAWLSPGLRERSGLSLDCLRARGADPISHDHFFHSVLGLMDVNTQAYRPALDALAPCAAPRVQAADLKPPSAG